MCWGIGMKHLWTLCYVLRHRYETPVDVVLCAQASVWSTCGRCVMCSGIGMKHLWKPALTLYTEMLAMLEANYPEALKRCYVVNGTFISWRVAASRTACHYRFRLWFFKAYTTLCCLSTICPQPCDKVLRPGPKWFVLSTPYQHCHQGYSVRQESVRTLKNRIIVHEHVR